jgi:uncharacterized protein (TIGR02246 family)
MQRGRSARKPGDLTGASVFVRAYGQVNGDRTSEGDEMSTAANGRAAVERYLAAAEAGDAEAVREVFAEDASWQLGGDLPISGRWNGRDAIVDEFLASALSYYEPGSVSLEVTSIVADGDQVVVEWTSRARNRAGWPYENLCIGVFTVRDGRIHAVREYMDTLYAYRVAFAGSS